MIGLIIGIAVAAVVVIGLIAVFGLGLALKSSKDTAKAKQKNEVQLDADSAAVLSKGRENLMTLRRLVMQVKESGIHAQGNDVCATIEKILNTLKEKPEKISSVRQLLNYYMPTLGEVLLKYQRIEKSGVDHDDMTEKVKIYLGDVQKAMDKQYENLFTDDMLDMSVDMEAMTMAVKRDGLIADTKEEIEQDNGGTISLTL